MRPSIFFSVCLGLLASAANAATDQEIAAWLGNRNLRPVPSGDEVAGYLTKTSWEVSSREWEAKRRQQLEAAGINPDTDRALTAVRPSEAAPALQTVEPLALAQPPLVSLVEIPPSPRLVPIPGETYEAFRSRVAGTAAEVAREVIETPAVEPRRAPLSGVGERARGLTGLFQRLFQAREGASSGAGSSAGTGAGSTGSGVARPSGRFTATPSMSGGGGAMSMAELQVAQAGGMGQPFREMGMRIGPGPDGRSAVLRADGSPASPGEVNELQKRLAREPMAQMKRPDFYQVIPREKFQELRTQYATRPELRGTTFKDVAATPEVRDFQWGRTCGRLEGGCNENAAQGSYVKGRYVAPEDLNSMSLDATKRLAGAAASDKKDGKPRSRRSQEFWDKLQKEDEEYQKKIAQEESARKGGAASAAERPAKSRLGVLLEALSSALGAGQDAGDGSGGEAMEPEPDGPAVVYDEAARAASGARRGEPFGARANGEAEAAESSEKRLRRRAPETDARRLALGAFMALLAGLIVVYARLRLKERES